MKSFFALCCAFICASAFSQDSTILSSRFEVFSSTAERVYRTNHRRVGNVARVAAELYKTVDLKSGDTARALLLGSNAEVNYRFTTGIFVDDQDLRNVLNFLTSMKDIIRRDTHDSEPSYTYITARDVIFSCEYDRSVFRKGWWLKIGRVYKYLRTPVGFSVELNEFEVFGFTDLLQKSLSMSFEN
jgi:hypothetical protein